MASQQGLEPRTLALEGPYSIQLSYCDILNACLSLFIVSDIICHKRDSIVNISFVTLASLSCKLGGWILEKVLRHTLSLKLTWLVPTPGIEPGTSH